MLSWTDKKDDRLLPCPFCGAAPMAHMDYLQTRRIYRAHVECKSCGASMHASAKNTGILEGVIIDKWNTRTGK